MIKIEKSTELFTDECLECLKDSVLYDNYFTEKSAREFIKEGFKKKEIYIALYNNIEVAGFMRIDKKGVFSKFAFLRLIAVKKSFRGKSIGKLMIKYFEEIGFKKENNVFLVVGEINNDAKKLYEALGYKEVGKIYELYEKNLTENIMMKSK
jgi:ribosomal protein S18 acetylase RimI-like enzyme